MLSTTSSLKRIVARPPKLQNKLARLEVDTYDVVLTDISMPGFSGLELLGHVRQKYPETPVIIISGISDQEHAQGLIRLGAFEYLLKLFRLEVVERTVERAMDHRRRLLEQKQARQNREQMRDGDEWKIVK